MHAPAGTDGDGVGLGVGEGEGDDVVGRGDGEADRRGRAGLVRSAFGRPAGVPAGETLGAGVTGAESAVRCEALLRSRSRWRTCPCACRADAGSDLTRSAGIGWPGSTEMATPAAAAVAVATPVKIAARIGIAATYHPAAAASTGVIAAVWDASQPLRRAALTAAMVACRACAAASVSATRTARPPAAVRVSRYAASGERP
jgi:hypothetical protein